jgi:hypothetical protein
MFVNNVRNFVTLLLASNNFYYNKQFLVGLGFQQNILDRTHWSVSKFGWH